MPQNKKTKSPLKRPSKRRSRRRKQPLFSRLLGLNRSSKLISRRSPVSAWVLLVVVACVAGGYVIVTHLANAASYTGICSTNQNPLVCWRVNNNQVDGWPRDIDGDANQQWTAEYQGSVSGSWPFSNSSLSSQYYGVGVYEFYNSNTNKCAGTAGGNYVSMEMVSCSANTGYLFVWTTTGYIVNVLNSDHYGHAACVSNNGNYVDMDTNTCDTTWQQVHVTSPAPTPNTPPPSTPTPDTGGGGTSGGGTGSGGGTSGGGTSSGGSGGGTSDTGGTTSTGGDSSAGTGSTTTTSSGSTSSTSGGSTSGSSTGTGSGGGSGGGSATIQAPGNFTASVVGSNAIVSLSWVAPAGGAAISTYELDRSQDQTNWSQLATSLTATTFSDETVSYGVHYYYRVSATDAAGDTSSYATADVVTPAFTANAVGGSGGSPGVYTSDDGLASVSVPANALSGSADCSMSHDSTATKPASGQKAVVGPYTLVCKDQTANVITSFTGPLSWTFLLKNKLSGLGVPVLDSLNGNGQLAPAGQTTYNQSNMELTFANGSAGPYVVVAPVKPGLPWNLIAIVVALLAVVAGVAFIILKRERAISFNDYIRKKYYDI